MVGLVAGAAIAVSLVLGDAPEDHAIELVPADAAFYATFYLDPSLGQKRATQDVLERARDAGAGDGSGESLEDAVGALVTGSRPVDYESDVKPHVGSQLAIYARPGGEMTQLFSTNDSLASRRAMHRMLEREYGEDSYYRIVSSSYRGQPYEYVAYSEYSEDSIVAFAVVDGFVVVGNEDDVKASIDAARGASLASSERYSQARGSASDDVLAFAYVDGVPLEREAYADSYLDSDEITSLEVLAEMSPIAATLTADGSHPELDVIAQKSSEIPLSLEGTSALLESLPAEAIAAIALGDFGTSLREVLAGSGGRAEDLRDVVDDLAGLSADSDVASWVGQIGAYVAGADIDTVEGALVAETRSPGDSDRVLDQIEDYYSSEYDFDYNYVYGSDDGLGFDVFAGDDLFQVRGDSDRVIAGAGAAGISTDRALDANGGFGKTELYQRAAGMLGGYEPFLVLDTPPLRRVIEDAAEAEYDETYMYDVREWLSAVSTVAGGVRADDDQIRLRLVAEIGR